MAHTANITNITQITLNFIAVHNALVVNEFGGFGSCIYNSSSIIKWFRYTSASLCLSCPGCFFANKRITSGVLKASLIAAWIACQ